MSPIVTSHAKTLPEVSQQTPHHPLDVWFKCMKLFVYPEKPELPLIPEYPETLWPEYPE
jgi:hypothetical protein